MEENPYLKEAPQLQWFELGMEVDEIVVGLFQIGFPALDAALSIVDFERPFDRRLGVRDSRRHHFTIFQATLAIFSMGIAMSFALFVSFNASYTVTITLADCMSTITPSIS